MTYHLLILAFGSIITDPGKEIEEKTVKKICNFRTPFKIEFSRRSKKRNQAPTLACVENNGNSVNGTIFVLDKKVSYHEAINILYRREADLVGTTKEFKLPCEWMEIGETSSAEVEKIIFAKMKSNCQLTAEDLADAAIASINTEKSESGKRRDGIQYLYDVKSMGIKTPLMDDYEKFLLKKLSVNSLEEALKKTDKK